LSSDAPSVTRTGAVEADQRVRLNQGLYERLQVLVIEIKLPLERPIGQPPAALKHGNDLVQYRFKGDLSHC
jgi:hypothetical protein